MRSSGPASPVRPHKLTSTLFAALNVATGRVIGKHYKRRRRLEFRDFMNRVVKQYEGKEIHVILDNLWTHKPKRDLWLARHPNVHFHYTPTHTSWLNQIEIRFSILAAPSLKGTSFGSVPQLVLCNNSVHGRVSAIDLDQCSS